MLIIINTLNLNYYLLTKRDRPFKKSQSTLLESVFFLIFLNGEVSFPVENILLRIHNRLPLESDWHLISHNCITAESDIKVTNDYKF